MFCISCGKKIDDDSRFCEFCGEKQRVPRPETSAALPVPEVSEVPEVPEAMIEPSEVPEAPEADPDYLTKYDEEIVEEHEAGTVEAPELSETPSELPAGLPSAGYGAPREDNGFAPTDYNARYGGDPFEPEAPPVPEAAPAPETPYCPEDFIGEATSEDTEEAPVKVGAGRLICAGIIAVIAIIVLTVLSLAFSAKLGLSGGLVRKRVERMNINSILDADFDGDTICSNIYDGLDFGAVTGGAADKYSFRDFMGRTNFLEFAGEKAGNYADCIIGGGETDPSVTNGEVVSFFESNGDRASEVFGYMLKTADYNIMRSNLDESGFSDAVSLEGLNGEAGFALQNLSYVFSYITLAILLALVLVLLIWIAVITERRAKHITGLYGTVFIWSGVIVLLTATAVTAGAAVAYILTGWFEFYVCSSVMIPFALFAACTGAFEFALGFIFRKIRKTIRTRDRRKKAVEKALAEHRF